jgi:hypothetical protein
VYVGYADNCFANQDLELTRIDCTLLFKFGYARVR